LTKNTRFGIIHITEAHRITAGQRDEAKVAEPYDGGLDQPTNDPGEIVHEEKHCHSGKRTGGKKGRAKIDGHAQSFQ